MARVAIGADEKKKLYVLGGLLVAIMVVVFALYRPTGSSSSGDDAPTPPTKSAKAPDAPPTPPGGAPGDAPGADAAAPGGGTGGSGAGGITAASLVSVSDFRNDPFEPFAKPIPTPTAPPPPAPPGPVVIAPPSSIEISQPGGFIGGLPPFGISSSAPSFGGTPPSRILRELPPPYIPRIAIAPTAPANFLPPGGAGAGGSSRSSNKRLSGVIIGDSVRAILEITSGESIVTRIVQPGDEVDGIRILRIERTTEGGRSVTRMYIRENGEERFVDLRPAPQATGGAGGIPGIGAPGGGMRPPF